jgi:mitogen-activated protein kinase kinase kinase 9
MLLDEQQKEQELNKLRKEVESTKRQAKMRLKQNEEIKKEVDELKQVIRRKDEQLKKNKESNKLESNSEINDVMEAFKNELKADRTLKPYYEIDFNDITTVKPISEGGFGLIYKARWRESTVAVKLLKQEFMKEDTIKDFLNECYAMESLRHPNIVMFLGACTKYPNLAIVLEYCSNKSLWSVLQNKKINLTWRDRRKLALGIAKGMNYLHLFPTPVLHRDLKSLNVLIDSGFKPKIADFGWTRLKADKMTQKIGTFQWMAPEIIRSQQYTEKADVYSFGIILWELAAREPPFKNMSGPQVALEVANNNLRPNIPKATPDKFAKLMKRCWVRWGLGLIYRILIQGLGHHLKRLLRIWKK